MGLEDVNKVVMTALTFHGWCSVLVMTNTKIKIYKVSILSDKNLFCSEIFDNYPFE